MPNVTVIVPVYNKAPHLRRCLESLCAQTLDDLAIVVVDDGSTDGSAEILSEMASADARIHLIEQANAGPSAARNAGMAVATGEFVGFVDADDWVEPRMFELLHSAAVENACVGARCGYTLDREDSGTAMQPSVGTPTTQISRGRELYRRLFDGPDISLMTACAGIYRREALAAHSIHFDSQLDHTEDALFNAEFYSLDVPIWITGQPLYHYMQRPGSLGRRHDPKLYRSIDRLYHCVTALEESPDATRRESALDGHAAFTKYICWYFAIALADEHEDALRTGPDFEERASRILEDSRMTEIFDRAEREGLLATVPGWIWRLLRSGRYRLLGTALRLFNLARALRRLA